MYNLIQHAPIRWPQSEKHGIEVSRDARDLITKVSIFNKTPNTMLDASER
jgi:hypothetical protein